MNHFWQDLPNYFDYQDVYTEAVRRAPSGGRLVELGVYEGASLAFLAVEAANSDKKLDIIGIDLFQNDYAHYHRVNELFKSRDLDVTLYRESTSNTSNAIANGTCDFVFVDADHGEDCVYRDIQLYWPKLKPGGYMAGHDLLPGDDPTAVFPGVEKAVRRFFGSKWEKVSRRCWQAGPK